ncbi:hypothetical protein [Kribbella sp. NPDC051770]|uniref:hypothetical protein n=1 Tax=Kribbella sp. NPDC051770 TaxID=3155413 RepID=UPI00343E3C09
MTGKAVIGVVAGVLLGWLTVTLGSYAGNELYIRRLQRFEDAQSETLPWLLALVAIGLVMGGLMSIRSFGSGVMAGTGLLMTVAGIAVQVLPLRTAVDLIKLFELPGRESRGGGGLLLIDGMLVIVGILLLITGVRRMVVDAKPPMPLAYRDPQARPGLQPGQYHPGQQPPSQYQPGQYQPGQYHPGQHPGQQHPGQTFPGSQDRPH